PREHHALPLQAEVVVERRRAVLLDDVDEVLRPLAHRGRLALGLRRHAEPAFPAVFLERHGRGLLPPIGRQVSRQPERPGPAGSVLPPVYFMSKALALSAEECVAVSVTTTFRA